MFVDTHCHLYDEDYDLDSVISGADLDGVKYLVLGSSSYEDNIGNLELCESYDNLFVTLGYHPDCANSFDFSLLDSLRDSLKSSKVVGIGEIGLDYHYGKENIDEQKELFIKQLEIAEEFNLPVVIHTRDATFDTYDILSRYKVKGIIHCFSGSLEMAKKFIDLGFYLGIGGVVTFKNSKLGSVVREVGLENIVLETDSPYLSPFRGEKNEPKNVKIVAEYIANLLDVSVLEVGEVTTSNAFRVFDLSSKV